jgi:hypothetical protein
MARDAIETLEPFRKYLMLLAELHLLLRRICDLEGLTYAFAVPFASSSRSRSS